MTIAIIGAGITGLYLGWKLSEKGYQVTIFEKKEKIGKKACSGLFSERILEFIPQSQKLIQNQIESALIHLPERSEGWRRTKVHRLPERSEGWRRTKVHRLPKKTIKVRFSRKFFVMSHFELDNLVANLAENSGVKIILNRNINSIPEGFDRIIGCDGPNSMVRKNLGLSEPSYRLAIQGFISKKDSSNAEDLSEVKKKEFSSPFVETWPIKSGFLWRIPRGKEIVEASPHLPPRPALRNSVTEYGIISNPKEAKTLFENFLKKNNLQLPERSEGWRRTKVLRLSRLESGIVPQGFLIPKHSLITLCGDSTGLTKPWSGGGVIWGLTSAEILLKNFPNFLKYQKEMKKTFLPKIIFSKIATKIVYFLGFNFPWILPKNIKIESDFLI